MTDVKWRELELSFANIVALDLPDSRPKGLIVGTKQSLYLLISVGTSSVASETENRSGTNVVWDQDALRLRVDEQQWRDPGAQLTLSVQNDRHLEGPNVGPASEGTRTKLIGLKRVGNRPHDLGIECPTHSGRWGQTAYP